MDTLHLVLTYYWYDETASGRKLIEYREIKPYWTRLIWDRRHTIKRVKLSRGYTSTTMFKPVVKIDIGPCPIAGWIGDYYRIHYGNEKY